MSSDQLRDWRGNLNSIFCTTEPENADANETLTRARRGGWIQAMVFAFGRNHGWGGSIGEFNLTVDPNFYDAEGTRIKGQTSYPAFCDRGGRSLDADGVVKRTWQDVELRGSIPFLFAHQPENLVSRTGTASTSSSEGTSVSDLFREVDRLFEPEICEPANGWILPCSDMRLLAPSDIRHLRPIGLLRAQYEILARKGTYFADETVQQYFEQFPWYEPFTRTPVLTDIEQANSALLQKIRLQQLRRLEAIDQ